jgi:hypothetical protein
MALGFWTLVGAVGVAYVTMAWIVGGRSLRWNRRQGRSQGTALAVSVLAAVIWPVTISFWEADWLSTGRRSWRGDK